MSNTTKKIKAKKKPEPKYTRYTKDDNDMLVREYASTDVRVLAARLGRSIESVRSHAHHVLGLTKRDGKHTTERQMRMPIEAERKPLMTAFSASDRIELHNADTRALAHARRHERDTAARCITVRVGKSVITGLPHTVRDILQQRGYTPQEIDQLCPEERR